VAEISLLAINTIRTLAMDAVEKAKSGHPGTAMGLAPVVYLLWQEFLRFDPENPAWPNRDRFVLSAGHASILLYSLLHLTETKSSSGQPAVRLDDLKRFRQLHSRCPGHPEYGLLPGVEATTGPLGQGAGNSIGMAIAGRWLGDYFNRPDFDVFNYDVYALIGDGCMMEGISSEAASLAGHLRLSNLCWIYDNNRITIDGDAALSFSEDVATRFMAYGWNVTHVSDANDLLMLRRAFENFKETHDRPTLIIVDSHIAFGAPHKEDTSAAHGSPLGEEEIRLTKMFYRWPENAKFLVPQAVREHFRSGIGQRGSILRVTWERNLIAYRRKFSKLAEELDEMERRGLPEGWDHELPDFPTDPKGLSGRDASEKVLNRMAKRVPWLIGGSADLASSTKAVIHDSKDFHATHYLGRNIRFGVREHGMGAVLNGLALSKIRPFGATFLVFSDYERASIRLSAMMKIPVIHIFTHDSISLGEDGPTHQPIEQIASLRAIPGLMTLRPADANEVLECWKMVMQLTEEPAALVLSRQPLPTFDRTRYAPTSGTQRGAYVLADSPDPEVLLLGTGSEVALLIAAYERLASDGVRARVVSMPSWNLFERQALEYRNEVLPPRIKARVAVEAASVFGWERYVGLDGAMIGMETFGTSAPPQDVQNHFGFTVENVISRVKKLLQNRPR